MTYLRGSRIEGRTTATRVTSLHHTIVRSFRLTPNPGTSVPERPSHRSNASRVPLLSHEAVYTCPSGQYRPAPRWSRGARNGDPAYYDMTQKGSGSAPTPRSTSATGLPSTSTPAPATAAASRSPAATGGPCTTSVPKTRPQPTRSGSDPTKCGSPWARERIPTSCGSPCGRGGARPRSAHVPAHGSHRSHRQTERQRTGLAEPGPHPMSGVTLRVAAPPCCGAATRAPAARCRRRSRRHRSPRAPPVPQSWGTGSVTRRR